MQSCRLEVMNAFFFFFSLLLFKTYILKLEAIPKLIWSFAPLLSLIPILRERLLISSSFVIIIITAWNNSDLKGKTASAIKVKVIGVLDAGLVLFQQSAGSLGCMFSGRCIMQLHALTPLSSVSKVGQCVQERSTVPTQICFFYDSAVAGGQDARFEGDT